MQCMFASPRACCLLGIFAVFRLFLIVFFYFFCFWWIAIEISARQFNSVVWSLQWAFILCVNKFICLYKNTKLTGQNNMDGAKFDTIWLLDMKLLICVNKWFKLKIIRYMSCLCYCCYYFIDVFRTMFSFIFKIICMILSNSFVMLMRCIQIFWPK